MKTTAIALAVIILLTSVAYAQTETLAEILSDESCPAACYLGIAPGITSQTELESILHSTNISYTSGTIGLGGNLIAYTLSSLKVHPNIRSDGDSMYIDVTADTVDLITVLLTDVTVADVVSWFGAPDVVKDVSGRGSDIIYIDKGLIFETLANDINAIGLVYITPPGRNALRMSMYLEGATCTLSAENCSIPTATPGFTSPSPTPIDAQERVLFDDFNYEAYDDPALSENGWVVRAGEGWPGVPGAIWRAENVSFVADSEGEDNRLMQMTSSTEGDQTYQTQVCQQRKFYEGTYATRVHFSDVPVTGPDGDNVVQTFYLISPQEYDMAPDYSELDFEYLPNGGWGLPGHVLHATTWETFQLEPWIADNTNDHLTDSFVGWHTLVLQIMDGTATYYVDGELFATHDGKYYPEVPMSINYNLWFIRDGQIRSTDLREYVERVDWMYFAANVALTPDEINARVAALRKDGTTFADTVPDWTPPLETPCNF